MPSENKKVRVLSLDVIRTLAIFLVIVTHASDSSYQYTNNEMSLMMSPSQRIFALTLHIIGRCGVPLFMYLTGYLVLTKKFNSANDIITFYKTHILPIILTSTIWGVVYYIVGIILYKRILSIVRLVLEIFTFNYFEGSQFWYIPCIIGIYLFIPFVSIVINNVDKRFVIIPIVSLIYISLPATINPILNAAGIEFQLYSNVDLSWSGGQYGLLVIMGYLISKVKYKKHYQLIAIITGIVAYLAALWEENYCCINMHSYDIWYNNITIILMSMSIFIAILPITKIRFYNIFKWISKSSFGIYLVHNLFRDYFSYIFSKIELWRKFVVIFAITSCLSILLVWILNINKSIAKITINHK